MKWLFVAMLLVGCGVSDYGPELLADYPEEEQAEVLAASMVDGVMWRTDWESRDLVFELYYRSSDGSMCVVEGGEVFECYETHDFGGFSCWFDHPVRDSFGIDSSDHDATTTYVNLHDWPCPSLDAIP